MAAPEQMRVLVDTPIWIDHFHRDDPALRQLLLDDSVCVAPPVLGELIAGNLPQRKRTIADLRLLPRLPDPSPDEVFDGSISTVWAEKAYLGLIVCCWSWPSKTVSGFGLAIDCSIKRPAD
jgi:hypothetical protein